MEKWYIKILLVVLVVGLAELGYTIFNRPQILLKTYLWQVENLQKDSLVSERLEYVDLVYEVRARKIAENYQKAGEAIDWLKVQREVDLSDDELRVEIEKLLDGERVSKLMDAQRLTYLYYQLGLLGTEHGNSKLVEYAWGRAIRLAPEWSYFHTELANYYLQEGSEDKAFATLEFCENFEYARGACNEYFEERFEYLRLMEIGHWRGKIEDGYLQFSVDEEK